MKFAIIVGSQQVDSQSAKVGRYLAAQLSSLEHQSYTLDLGSNPLPLWDNSIWSGDPVWQERLAPINAELESCDGLIVISPEYHGMAPAGLKNFFLLFGKEVLGHKPGYIVAVSASAGGAYPIAELRMSSYKNSRLCYTPDHTIVRSVGKVLNEHGENDERSDNYTRKQLGYGLAMLVEYAKALGQVRSSGVVDHKNFGNGM